MTNVANRLRGIPDAQASIGVQTLGNTAADLIVTLTSALRELLDAFEIEAADMDLHEYEAIVADAKRRGRAAISKATA